MLAALNDDLPDDLLSGWESSNSNGNLTNGSADQLPSGAGPPNGPQQPPMMNSGGGMPRNMNLIGGMGGPNQNMNLVNALNKNKTNGPGGMVGFSQRQPRVPCWPCSSPYIRTPCERAQRGHGNAAKFVSLGNSLTGYSFACCRPPHYLASHTRPLCHHTSDVEMCRFNKR